MSSGEIRALISDAKIELGKYVALKGAIGSLVSSIDNAKSLFAEASVSLETGFTVNGVPADRGKTTDFTNELNGAIGVLEGALGMISPEIERLENEIQQLNNDYNAAIAREQAARNEAARKAAEEVIM